MRLGILLVLFFILFPCSLKGKVFAQEAVDYKEYKESLKELGKEKKNDYKLRQERIAKKFDEYIAKEKEPILMWGIGYMKTLTLEMKGRLRLDLGKDNKVENLWTNILISDRLEIGFDYMLAQRKNFLPTYYVFFPGAGFGIDLNDFKSYGYLSVSAGYFFSRSFGVMLKVQNRLDDFGSFGADNFGVLFEYRF